jgi:hypothetical protein
MSTSRTSAERQEAIRLLAVLRITRSVNPALAAVVESAWADDLASARAAAARSNRTLDALSLNPTNPTPYNAGLTLRDSGDR